MTLAEFDRLTISTAMLSRALGLSRKGVAEHAAAGRLKRVGHGEFLLAESMSLYAAHLRAVASGRGGAVADERERLARIRADRAQMAFDVERGKLGDVEEVHRLRDAVDKKVIREAMRIPWIMAAELSATRYDGVIMERELRRCLSNIGRGRPAEVNGPDTDFDEVAEDGLTQWRGPHTADGLRIIAEAKARRARAPLPNS
jgi:hypothetical protein